LPTFWPTNKLLLNPLWVEELIEPHPPFDDRFFVYGIVDPTAID
jgi:hypothetical protein